MQVNAQENRKEILDMLLCGDVLFVLFREGSIRGVDMTRYRGIPKDGVVLLTPEELYDNGTTVLCMLWDGEGKLIREEITSNEDGIYVRYGSKAHKALNSLYREGMMAECRKLWH
jgi:hypothetical protein